ncbi:hypothetical protein INR49_023066 [Caranx melampygus]|nr:hypothetical protein INR49_023066 [Caranx melampygus]
MYQRVSSQRRTFLHAVANLQLPKWQVDSWRGDVALHHTNRMDGRVPSPWDYYSDRGTYTLSWKRRSGRGRGQENDRQAEISESSHSASFASSGYTERKRRTLPSCQGRSLSWKEDSGSGLRTDMGEKQDTELQEKENQGGRWPGKDSP